MAEAMGKEPRFTDEALRADESPASEVFGPYRDDPDEMIGAAARRVVRR